MFSYEQPVYIFKVMFKYFRYTDFISKDPIFTLMAREGNVDEHMMYNTYNMGLGMVLAVDPADVDKTMEAIKAAGDTPYVVGKITDGEKGVTLC